MSKKQLFKPSSPIYKLALEMVKEEMVKQGKNPSHYFMKDINKATERLLEELTPQSPH